MFVSDYFLSIALLLVWISFLIKTKTRSDPNIGAKNKRNKGFRESEDFWEDFEYYASAKDGLIDPPTGYIKDVAMDACLYMAIHYAVSGKTW